MMNIRICPKCGKHNQENAWSCIRCGETLSVKALVDANDTQLVSAISKNIKSKIAVERELKLKATTQIKVMEKEKPKTKLTFTIYVIFVTSALITNWIFSTMTVGLIVFGIQKEGGDIGSPAIALATFLFINGILSLITAAIMSVAKVREKEFPARFSALIFILTYFPFHILGLYVPDKVLGYLETPVGYLSVLMLFFSFIPLFHTVSQGLINIYDFFQNPSRS